MYSTTHNGQRWRGVVSVVARSDIEKPEATGPLGTSQTTLAGLGILRLAAGTDVQFEYRVATRVNAGNSEESIISRRVELVVLRCKCCKSYSMLCDESRPRDDHSRYLITQSR